MHRRILLSTAVATMCAVTMFAPPSSAENGNAECQNLPGEVSDSGWTSHEQLGDQLARIEAISFGRVKVDVIGHSHRGRDIYAARVGTGDRVLLITSEIHGNEKTGTEALLQMLKTLGSSNSPQAQAVRDGVTIVAVPKFNADGGELNRRQNDFPWTEVVQKFPQLAGMSPAVLLQQRRARLRHQPGLQRRPRRRTKPGGPTGGRDPTRHVPDQRVPGAA